MKPRTTVSYVPVDQSQLLISGLRGGLGGALLGLAVAGPGGALVGVLFGALIGSAAGALAI